MSTTDAYGRGLFAAKVYFLWNNASNACIYPFLNLYFTRKGFTKTQIGWMSAIRPWVSAISGNIWAAAADHLQAHFVILLVMYMLGVLLRTSMMFAPDFATMLVVVIAKEFCGSPVGIIVDATVLAAGKLDSDYGKTRMWGAVGWGGFSPIAGAIVTRYGINSAFIVSLITGALGTFLAALLPVQALSRKRRNALACGSRPCDPKDDAEGPDPAATSDDSDSLGSVESLRKEVVPAGSLGQPHEVPRQEGLRNTSLSPDRELLRSGENPRHGDASSPGTGMGSQGESPAGHHLIRLRDVMLDVGREAGGYVTVTVVTGKSTKLSGGIEPLPSCTSPGTASEVENPLAEINGPMYPELRDSIPTQDGTSGTTMRSAASGSIRISRDRGGSASGGVASGVDVAWPASWPPCDFGAAVGGGSAAPAGRARSLERISSVFLHEVEAHLPVAPVPELAAYDQVSLAWTASALRDVKHSSRAPHQEDKDGALEEPLLQDADWAGDDSESAPGEPGLADVSFLHKVGAIFATEGAPVFFFMAILMGYAMGTIDFALFLYLDELGASEALMGLTVTVTCLSEIPVFFFTGWLLRKLGVNRVLHIVLACFLLRLFCYTQLQAWGTPYAVLPVELLHGITFGCAWASGTVNCARLSPPGLETTTQAIFNSLYQGIGLGLGGLVGGIMYHKYGPRAVFINAACVVAVGWAMCLFLQHAVSLFLKHRRLPQHSDRS